MNITLTNENHSLTLKTEERKLSFEQKDHKISFDQVGIRGLPGRDGIDGVNGDDGLDDKHYEYSFTNQSLFTVTHNLGKYPAITVFNSAGDEVEGEYKHLSTNSTTLTFSAGFTGKAIFN